ncbi:hypothetical protein HDU67_000408 [Dinochytrium kinnereticum]|nr:hypothetical protein HDU67_000408 [Dinochytrium kinnereticum]
MSEDTQPSPPAPQPHHGHHRQQQRFSDGGGDAQSPSSSQDDDLDDDDDHSHSGSSSPPSPNDYSHQQQQHHQSQHFRQQHHLDASSSSSLPGSSSSSSASLRKSIYDPVPVFPANSSASLQGNIDTMSLPHPLVNTGHAMSFEDVRGSGKGSHQQVHFAHTQHQQPQLQHQHQQPQLQHQQQQTQASPASSAASAAKSKKPAPKRRKVSQACVYCRRSHMTCDEGRPCQRCIKRKIAHLCHDESKGPSGGGPTSGSVGSLGDSFGGFDGMGDSSDITVGPSTAATAASEMVAAAAAAVASGATLPPAVVAAVANALPALAGPMMDPSTNGAVGMANTTRADGSVGYTFPALSAFPPLFASEHMGNEFTILTDFLASLDEMNGGKSHRGSSGHSNGALALRDVASGDMHDRPATAIPASTNGLGITDPTSQLSSTEKFVLTAADPGDGTYDDRLNQVITAKFEAGLLKPYNYVNSYARLQKWMETHMSPSSRARILNVMGIFRPKFRWIAQSLTDIDLVLVEEAFERLLLEYDRVFSSMGIPSCLWRRTGEICKCNKEFASLVGLPMEKLRDGKVHIYELMSEESAIAGNFLLAADE